MNIDDIIENIKNDYYRKLIKNIFNKLDDEEIYVILELNNQLQDKLRKINKVRRYIKKCMKTTLKINDYWTNELVNGVDILKILGDKE